MLLYFHFLDTQEEIVFGDVKEFKTIEEANIWTSISTLVVVRLKDSSFRSENREYPCQNKWHRKLHWNWLSKTNWLWKQFYLWKSKALFNGYSWIHGTWDIKFHFILKQTPSSTRIIGIFKGLHKNICHWYMEPWLCDFRNHQWGSSMDEFADESILKWLGIHSLRIVCCKRQSLWVNYLKTNRCSQQNRFYLGRVKFQWNWCWFRTQKLT